MPALAIEAPPTERRVAPRRQPTLGTVCHLNLERSDEPELGLVWNISTTGISMLLCERPRADACLTGTLLTMDGEHEMPISIRVVHVKKLETGDYLMGAQFSEAIVPDDLSPFVV